MSDLDLVSARKSAGLSQAEVALVLGVSQATVSAWERGRIAISIGNLIDYAAAVGVPASSLFVGGPGPDGLELAYQAGWADCAATVIAAARREEMR